MPNFVATTTATELEWNATRIEGDLAAAIDNGVRLNVLTATADELA